MVHTVLDESQSTRYKIVRKGPCMFMFNVAARTKQGASQSGRFYVLHVL